MGKLRNLMLLAAFFAAGHRSQAQAPTEDSWAKQQHDIVNFLEAKDTSLVPVAKVTRDDDQTKMIYVAATTPTSLADITAEKKEGVGYRRYEGDHEGITFREISLKDLQEIETEFSKIAKQFKVAKPVRLLVFHANQYSFSLLTTTAKAQLGLDNNHCDIAISTGAFESLSMKMIKQLGYHEFDHTKQPMDALQFPADNLKNQKFEVQADSAMVVNIGYRDAAQIIRAIYQKQKQDIKDLDDLIGKDKKMPKEQKTQYQAAMVLGQQYLVSFDKSADYTHPSSPLRLIMIFLLDQDKKGLDANGQYKQAKKLLEF